MKIVFGEGQIKNAASQIVATLGTGDVQEISRIIIRSGLTPAPADGLCPNCGKDYFVEETIVDGELHCSCARR